ncbi:hypothetical protein JAAARDRAFT_47092 [Jaapia argillacea MUCL 33604]|uniref:Uncharacterized protein n=1 Tax=Jaapia argillacea MUCL 33604 TaxID=933084 RepID=A0A067PXY9_9AGAM|nr:hypothetical protein JAAARDRAFT_47092 [Jaapia argillacea MUCL 33604]
MDSQNPSNPSVDLGNPQIGSPSGREGENATSTSRASENVPVGASADAPSGGSQSLRIFLPSTTFGPLTNIVDIYRPVVDPPKPYYAPRGPPKALVRGPPPPPPPR